jgi:hypothetical protein
VLRFEIAQGCGDVVTHQEEFVVGGLLGLFGRGVVGLQTILFKTMKRGFGGRQGEDQPAVAGVHGGELERVAEEGSVAFGIGGVEDDVDAVDHARLPSWESSSHRVGEFASSSESMALGIEARGIPPFAKSAKDGAPGFAEQTGSRSESPPSSQKNAKKGWGTPARQGLVGKSDGTKVHMEPILSPRWGLVSFPSSLPRLAPWAAFLRRFAAGSETCLRSFFWGADGAADVQIFAAADVWDVFPAAGCGFTG